MKHILSIILACSVPTLIFAQSPIKPAEVPKKNPPVPNVPVIPGGIPKAVQKKPVNKNRVDPNGVAAGESDIIDGSNWDDQDVANAYRKYTGKRVLLSSSTQNLEMRFFQYGPLTNKEAAILLEKVLGMEGFAFVPSGTNEVKLLPKAQGAKVDAPIETEGMIDSPENIPEGDAYISYFMRLNFIKPEEAIRTFTQSIHGLGAGAKIAPVSNASAIIVTGKASFIRKLLNQKEFIDVSPGNVSRTWVTLKFADSEEIATTLNEIMNAQQKGKTSGSVRNIPSRSARRVPVPSRRSASSGASSAGVNIPVQIIPSARLNKLFIMGRPVDVAFVEGLAREFDAPPNHNNFIKRKLRFMIASDFLQVASDALAAMEPTSSSKSGRPSSRSGRNSSSRGNTSSRNNSNTRNSGSGSRSSGAESVQEFNVSDVPESMVIGKTLIVADNLANSILVQGPPESLRVISELIDKLDGRPQQVMISTVFGDMSLGNMRELGFKWGASSNSNPIYDADGTITGYSKRKGLGAGSVNVGDKNPLADLVQLGSVAGLNAAGAGGLNLYGQLDNLNVVINALETHTDFKVLSRPTVYTANNRKAVISSGRRIAVPTNTFTSGATSGSTQSTNIEYRDVLLRFEVVPLINSEEEVTLRISLLNEDTQGVQIIDDNEIPTIVTESISTTVTIANNATVVLGGLVTEKILNSKSGVPILSSIPLIGPLFRSKNKSVDRRELLIFMQPRIVTNESTRNVAQRDLENRYEVTKPLKEFADGDDVLPARKSNAKSGVVKPTPKRKKKWGFRHSMRR